MAQMTPQQINDVAIEIVTDLTIQYDVKNARKIAKEIWRKLRHPTDAEWREISEFMQAAEACNPFGW